MGLNLMSLLKSFLEIRNRICLFLFLNKEKDSFNSSSGNSRTYLTSNVTLQINSKTKSEVENINKEAKALLKQFINDPEGLIKFIESKGTKVVRAPYIEKILALIGENEGFIYPLKGINALFLSIMVNILLPTKIGIGFKTPPLFVTKDVPLNVYLFCHQFHHWFGYIKGLSGYEERTLSNFKNIWNSDSTGNDISRLSINEVMSLKEAIARDIEAIKFVKEISRELIGSKNCSNRLKSGESLHL